MVTMKWAIEYADQNYKEGLAKGRKEVVEWMGKELLNVNYPAWYVSSQYGKKWESKLKEWGIKP
jgi:hypothetical protein